MACDSARPSSSPEASKHLGNVDQWQPTINSWNVEQGTSIVDSFMPESATAAIDLDYFNPAVTSHTFDAWVDFLEPGFINMPAE